MSTNPEVPTETVPDTRQRMLDAAIEVFGQRGFEATSTRMLVSRAGTQLTAISYHFSNKEGLYRAAAQYIADGIRGSFREQVQSVKQQLTQSIDKTALIEIACRMLEGFALRIIGREFPDSWSRFMSREFAEPTQVFPILFEAFQEFGGCLCHIVARLSGRAETDPEVILCMLTLCGQVLVFRSDRAASFRFLQWDKVDQTEMDLVRGVVWRNCEAILRSWAQ